MDPNANLAETLGLARGIVQFSGDHDDQAVRLAELAIALNEWILNGGFLPAAWASGLSAAEVGGE